MSPTHIANGTDLSHSPCAAPARPHNGLPSILGLITVALLAFAYLAQIPSHLRLNTDAIVLLGIGASAADGHGFLYLGQATHFPPGYPAIVAGLDYLGLASSQSFILVNCIFIGAMLFSGYRLYRDTLGLTVAKSAGLCCLVMLSFVLIKHATLTISDVMAGGLFMTALLLLTKARNNSGRLHWGYLPSGAVVTGLTIATRTIGVALLPVLAFVMLRPVLLNLPTLWKTRPRVFKWILLGIIGFGLLCGFFILRTKYAHEMMAVYFDEGIAHRFWSNITVHLSELGQLGANLPNSKIPAFLRPVAIPLGVIVVLLVARGLWLRRRSIACMEIALLAYAGIIFIWPYEDTRFWLMVLPLLVGYVALSATEITRLRYFGLTIPAACMWFAATGVLALAYSTRISWAGDRFPEFYGDGTLKPSYRAAMYGDRTGVVNDEVVSLIKRYDSETKSASAAP